MSTFKHQLLKLFLMVILFIFFVFPLSVFKAQEESQNLKAGTVSKDRYEFEMVYVPSGTFEMGISREKLNDLIQQGEFGETAKSQSDILLGEAQSEGVFDTIQVTLSAFWIDRYEVTIRQYESGTKYCISTGSCSPIDLSYAPQLTSDPDQPQVAVDWFDAMRFCVGREARLPSEAEWEYAAKGPEAFIFPWGNTLNYENLATDNTSYTVGSKPNNKSWVGAYDLAGNASEWVEDRIKPYIDSQSQIFLLQNRTDVYRVTRGGSYNATANLMTTFARGSEHPMSGEIGFRCARSIDPTMQ